jgi:hypothetical protein
MIKNIIITLLSAVAIFAAGNIETNTVPEADEVFINGSAILESAVPAPEITTNILWHIDDSNDLVELNLFNEVRTNWFIFDRFTNQPPASPDRPFIRQIGQLYTNQVITLTYMGRTNKIILKLLGKEEWTSQQQIIPEPPKPQPARRR